MHNSLSCLDQIVPTEEKIALHTSRALRYDMESRKKDRVLKEEVQRSTFMCMYCDEDHKAASCRKYRTLQERTKYLGEHKLCFLYASSRHITSACTKARGPHPNDRCRKPAKTRDITQESSVAQFNSFRDTVTKRDTYLPIGEMAVMDNTSRRLKKVAALMDSGAECSFIDSKFAEERGLPVLDMGEVGNHSELLTHDVLISSLKTPSILNEDVQFLKLLQVSLGLTKKNETVRA
ncbi:hypothetical protein OSTOST_00023, partial [Ostertagia ostertagi]